VTDFSPDPYWYPTGQGSEPTAVADCSSPSVTGGHVRYTPYTGTFDGDYDCG
jgi:hypothetical protein